MNGVRRRVRWLFADAAVGTVVVEQRDRLGRMNTELVAAALSAHGRTLVVLDDGEVDDDVVGDMVDVLAWLCVRLYGRGGARNRALRVTATETYDTSGVGVSGVGHDAVDG